MDQRCGAWLCPTSPPIPHRAAQGWAPTAALSPFSGPVFCSAVPAQLCLRSQLPFARSSAAFPVTPSPHGVWGCSGAEGSGWDHAQILLGSPRSHKPPLSAGPTACPTGRPTARFQRHCMKCGAEMGPVLLYRSPTNGGHGVSPAPQRRVWGHGQVGGTGTALGTWMGLGAQDVGTGKWGWEQLGPQE